MDLKFLQNGANKFAYELRKFFPSDERPVDHFVVDIGIVVLSNKKLYVMYYNGFIDYQTDILKNIEISNIDFEKGSCFIPIKKHSFNVVFKEKDKLKKFVDYYQKYRD